MGWDGGKRGRWVKARQILGGSEAVRQGKNKVKVTLFLGNKIQPLSRQPWPQLSEKRRCCSVTKMLLIYHYGRENIEGMLRIITANTNCPKSKDADGPIHPR